MFDVVGHGECFTDAGTTPLCASLTFAIAPTAGSNLAVEISVTQGVRTCGNLVQPINSVTYNASAIGIVTVQTTPWDGCNDGGNNENRISQYYLLNENTGSNNIVITPTATEYTIAGTATALQGVDQVTPIISGHSGVVTKPGADNGPATVTVTTAVGEMIVDHLCDGTSVGPAGTNQTNNYSENNTHTTCSSQGTSTKLGANGGTMSWTVGVGDTWGITAISFAAAASAASPITPSLNIYNGVIRGAVVR